MGNNTQFSVQGALNLGLGQAGCFFETGTTANTYNTVAIQFIEDTVFTTLTPEDSKFIGTSGGSGDAITTETFPAGVTIYGRWTGFTLSSGAVIAYKG